MVRKSEELGLLGLAKRAGKVIVGTEESRRAIRRGVARVVVIAGDASPGQRKKVVAVAQARQVPIAEALDRLSLGGAIGRGPVSALVVTDAGLASGLEAALGRRPVR